MLTNQKNIADFMGKAGQKVSQKITFPTEEETRLRVALVFEEALEFARACGVSISFYNQEPNSEAQALPLHVKDYVFDNTGGFDMAEVAGELADLDYVTNGAANTFGLDLEKLHEEVHTANMSKFIDGYRREDGKWIKGPSYRAADFKKLIEKLWDQV